MLNTSHKEVALLLVGYKRVDFLIDRLKEIKSNIPIPVYISVDGSDKLTEDEITKAVQNFISENRNMDITFKLQERNLGLAHHITTTISALLDKYPRLIVVEDDVDYADLCCRWRVCCQVDDADAVAIDAPCCRC